MKHIRLQSENGTDISLFEAIEILRDLNDRNRRKLPDDVPIEFIPKKLRPMVVVDGKVNKPAWECALLTTIRDEIKAGNLPVMQSKRFGRFDNFFIPKPKWQEMRKRFFKRAGFPTI